jgi:hypothetical protein
MLRQDGAHLFVGRELAPRDFLVGGGKVGIFLGRQLNHGFIVTNELQEEARDGILCFRGQGADGFNSVFEQFGHASLYHKWASPGQAKRIKLQAKVASINRMASSPAGSCLAMASACLRHFSAKLTQGLHLRVDAKDGCKARTRCHPSRRAQELAPQDEVPNP